MTTRIQLIVLKHLYRKNKLNKINVKRNFSCSTSFTEKSETNSFRRRI